MKEALCFAVDASLGKLGRHLRSVGFDTRCEHQCLEGALFWQSIGAERIVLTRTRAVWQRYRNHRHLFIHSNAPWRQLVQVMRDLQIAASDLQPFSRCIICNHKIRSVERQAVRGRVPDYVWLRHSSFQACHRCRRIYWAGSHRQRMQNRLASLLIEEGNSNS